MWTEARAWFATHRATLATAGIPLHATLVRGTGLYSAYVEGTVRLTLPDTETPEGLLQTLLLGGMMDMSEQEVVWLFHTLLPRLVAHEIGHALRAEAGQFGPDVLEEEQVADRLATLLSRSYLGPHERARLTTLLERVTRKLGGREEAASLHRHAGLARRQLGLGATDEVAARTRSYLQATYHRDVTHYLRLSVSWAWLDLVLEVEDSLEAFRRDHLEGALGRVG